LLYGCLKETGLEKVNPEEIIYERIREKLNPAAIRKMLYKKCREPLRPE